MTSPLFPVKINRTIQLRRLNAMDPDDMQQMISFARISETEQYVQSKNDALTRVNDRSVRNLYDRQATELSKLNRSQNTELARLERMLSDRKKCKDKKMYELAIDKTLRHTEHQNLTDRLTHRRHGLVPRQRKNEIKSMVGPRSQSEASNRLQVPGNNNSLTNRSNSKLSHDVARYKEDMRSTLPRISISDMGCKPTEHLVTTGDDINITITDLSTSEVIKPMEVMRKPRIVRQVQVVKSRSKQIGILQHASRLKKNILDAPFNSSEGSESSQRRDCNRDVTDSPVSRNQMLRKKYSEDTDKHVQRIGNFLQDLDKLAAWDATSYIQSLRPKEPEELRKPSVVDLKLQHIDIFGKYYRTLLHGLDPNSEEAMKYCRYIRDVDNEITMKSPRSARSARSAKSIVF